MRRVTPVIKSWEFFRQDIFIEKHFISQLIAEFESAGGRR